MTDENDPDLGRNMLRKTAGILIRTRLHDRLLVSDDFGALVMDGNASPVIEPLAGRDRSP